MVPGVRGLVPAEEIARERLLSLAARALLPLPRQLIRDRAAGRRSLLGLERMLEARIRKEEPRHARLQFAWQSVSSRRGPILPRCQSLVSFRDFLYPLGGQALPFCSYRLFVELGVVWLNGRFSKVFGMLQISKMVYRILSPSQLLIKALFVGAGRLTRPSPQF